MDQRRFPHPPKPGPSYSFDINKRLDEIGQGYKPLDHWRTETTDVADPVTRPIEADQSIRPLAIPAGATIQPCPQCQEEHYIGADDYICLRCRNGDE